MIAHPPPYFYQKLGGDQRHFIPKKYEKHIWYCGKKTYFCLPFWDFEGAKRFGIDRGRFSPPGMTLQHLKNIQKWHFNVFSIFFWFFQYLCQNSSKIIELGYSDIPGTCALKFRTRSPKKHWKKLEKVGQIPKLQKRKYNMFRSKTKKIDCCLQRFELLGVGNDAK